MLVITVVGFSGGPNLRKGLIREIKRLVAGIKELGVTEKQVSPLIIPAAQENEGEVIVAYVDFFEAESRTREAKLEMCKAVFQAIHNIVKGWGMKDPVFAKVIPHGLNPAEDGYCNGDVQTGELKYPESE